MNTAPYIVILHIVDKWKSNIILSNFKPSDVNRCFIFYWIDFYRRNRRGWVLVRRSGYKFSNVHYYYTIYTYMAITHRHSMLYDIAAVNILTNDISYIDILCISTNNIHIVFFNYSIDFVVSTHITRSRTKIRRKYIKMSRDL